MIIPMDISVQETTMSISIKGIYSSSPMVKARWSSVVINEGMIIRMGSSIAVASSMVSGVSTCARSQNIRMVFSRVLRIMKSFSGTEARSRNSSWLISSAT